VLKIAAPRVLHIGVCRKDNPLLGLPVLSQGFVSCQRRVNCWDDWLYVEMCMLASLDIIRKGCRVNLEILSMRL